MTNKKQKAMNKAEADFAKTLNNWGTVDFNNPIKTISALNDFVDKVAAFHPDGNPLHLIKEAMAIQHHRHLSAMEEYRESPRWVKASEAPESPESDAVAFLDWVSESGWILVSSEELGKDAWVNCKEEEVMAHGSDYHYTTLIKECGKSTSDLYNLFKQTVK